MAATSHGNCAATQQPPRLPGISLVRPLSDGGSQWTNRNRGPTRWLALLPAKLLLQLLSHSSGRLFWPRQHCSRSPRAQRHVSLLGSGRWTLTPGCVRRRIVRTVTPCSPAEDPPLFAFNFFAAARTGESREIAIQCAPLAGQGHGPRFLLSRVAVMEAVPLVRPGRGVISGAPGVQP